MSSLLDPKKIAVRCPNWLGDMMMLTAFLKALETRYPSAQIDLILKKGLDRLPIPSRGELIVYDKKISGPGRFGWSLRSRHYDYFYVLPPSFSSAWMAYTSGALRRIGYAHGGRGFLLNGRVPFSQPYRSQLLVNEWLQLIDSSYTVEKFSSELALSENWINEQGLSHFNLPKNFVALAPGAFHGPAKRWPPEQVRQLTKLIRQRHYSVVILGTVDDIDVGNFISEGDTGIINFCGKTSLNQMIAMLARAQLLVSNDSGPTHVMAALKRPQVALYGSTTPVWSAPLNKKATVFYTKEPCSPCFDRTCRFNHYNCLNKISVEEVAAAVYAQL